MSNAQSSRAKELNKNITSVRLAVRRELEQPTLDAGMMTALKNTERRDCAELNAIVGLDIYTPWTDDEYNAWLDRLNAIEQSYHAVEVK